MKVLVTGGAGFIGTRLVSQLLAAGIEVRVWDKVLSAAFPQLCTIGDVRDFAALSAACEGIDTVVHLAAEHADNVFPAQLYYDVNVGGAEALALACREHGVRRIVFTSSVAVYGLHAGIAYEDSRIDPFNDYGRSKWQAEQVLSFWQAEETGRDLIIIRPTVVFGEGNRGNVYNLFNAIRNKTFIMVGGGTNRKSMAYVENVADFIAGKVVSANGLDIVNYADGPDLTTNDLVDIIYKELGRARSTFRLPLFFGLAAGHMFDLAARLTGRRFPISAIRIRKFNSDTQVSTERALATGFVPRLTLADGLRRMVQFELRNEGQGADTEPKE